jgi:hypothetical protein
MVALVAGLLPAPPARAQEKVTLRLNLKPGQTYTLSQTTHQEINQTIGGNPQTMKQAFTFTYSFKPSKVDPDGTIHGTYKHDAITVKMQGPGGQVDYDSSRDKEPPTNPMAKPFAALVGKELQVVMTPRGEVKELKGADEILAAVLESMGDLPEQVRATAKQQMESQFGEAAMKESFEQMTAIYPKDPVAVGESWDVEHRVTAGMPMVINTTYTLKSLDGGRATLDFKGTAKTDPDAPAGIVPGAKFSLEGTQTGSLALDQATGWIASGTLKQAMDGKMSVDVGGQQVEVPMQIKSDATIGGPNASGEKK